MKSYYALTVLCFLLCQTAYTQNNIDSVFTLKGDTLLGKVTLNKEKNKFFVATDTSEILLDPSNVASFVTYKKEDDYERKEYSNLLGSFYLIEFGKNAYITVYSKTTYKMKEQYSQKYYTAKTDYCFFKDNVPYFYNAKNYHQTIDKLIGTLLDRLTR